MPYGVIVNTICILAGAALGAVLKQHFSERLRTTLPTIFGLTSMSLGIVNLPKVVYLPAVSLAVILGTLLGEGLRLEDRVIAGTKAVLSRTKASVTSNDHLDTLVAVTVLFCTSGTGIIGAMEANLTGNNTLLFTKSILDFFTAMIFGAVLGPIVCLIALPQFVIMAGVFFSGGALAPLINERMIADFTACGGLLMLATGFRIAKIKPISTVNMLPALLLIMPFSQLWYILSSLFQ